jgi:hypothetical protein
MLPFCLLSSLSSFLTILPPPSHYFPLFPPYSPVPVIITLFFLSFFSLCSIFSSITFILFIQSASFACHFSSVPLIPSITAANSFALLSYSRRILSYPYFYFLLRFCLGIFPFSKCFGRDSCLSSDVLSSSLSLLLFFFLTFGDFIMRSLFFFLFSHADGKIRDGYGEDGCGRKVVGTERLIPTQHSP